MKYPDWICKSCGEKFGKAKNGLIPYVTGRHVACGWCNSCFMVTEPENFGCPPLEVKSDDPNVIKETLTPSGSFKEMKPGADWTLCENFTVPTFKEDEATTEYKMFLDSTVEVSLTTEEE